MADSTDSANPMGAVPRLVRLEYIIIDELPPSVKKQLSNTSSCSSGIFQHSMSTSSTSSFSSDIASPGSSLSSHRARMPVGRVTSDDSSLSFSSDVSNPASCLSSQVHRMPVGRVKSDDSSFSFEDSEDMERPSEEPDSSPLIGLGLGMRSDSIPPNVRLLFQPRSGGILVIKDDSDLDIIPPRDAKHFELEEITKISFKQEEGGGLCVTFQSRDFGSCIIGYPRNGFVVKGNGRSDDHRTWWRLRFFRDVFQHSLPKYEDSVLLQLWYDRFKCEDPKEGLFFVIESGPNYRKYKLGPLQDARTMGAFNIDCVSHCSS